MHLQHFPKHFAIMSNTLSKILLFTALTASLTLTSCMGDDDNERYKEWRKQNIEYVQQMMELKENGELVYTTVHPTWAPGDFVLMRWHNNRQATEKNLMPLYNSTCLVKYKVSTLEQAVDSSYNMTTYGDSLYKCKPMNTIQGFAIALTSMHIGDSCTVIIPYFVGYDTSTTSNIKKPYSTLIYGMKLVDIPAYEIPN